VSNAVAVVAALGSAGLFGLASAAQHHEVQAVPSSVRPSLLLTLARRPLWLVGAAADVGAVALQAFALTRGSVALVQGLLVAGLPLAVVLSAVLGDRRLRAQEISGLLLTSSGLAVLGPALATTADGSAPTRESGALVAAIVAALVVGLLLLRERPRWGGLCAGAAAGATVGAGAVLLSVASGRVGDWHALFTGWALYAALVVGLAGLLLAQIAFQTGDLGAPLATLTVVEPIVAVAVAAAVLHEHLPTDPGRLLALAVGSALAVAGVLALTLTGNRS
jgi:drug/metabolite transporter (DMT)-like permease